MTVRAQRGRGALTRRAFCGALGGALALAGCKGKEQPMGKAGTGRGRVVVLGMDGVDPALLTRFRAEGLTPHFEALAREGGFAPLATTNPAESPVAWATLATGVNPGRHGVFDFLHRDPADYRLLLSITRPKGRSLTGTPVFESPLRATPFWERAAEAGIPAQVLRWPLTFPAAGKATVLAGLGTPDIQGGLGRYALYTTDAALAKLERRGETLLLGAAGGGTFATEIRGPRKSASEYVTAPLTIKPSAGKVTLTCSGGMLDLREGAWSPRVSLTFSVGLFKKVKATAQFHLVRAADPLVLYLSPLAIDPADPVFPLSAPADFAPKLAKALGAFHTLGMHEDINALKDGVLSPAAFLASCDEAMGENEKLLAHALAAQDRGLLCAVFFTPDRIQHFFWAGLDREHPFNAKAAGEGLLDHTGEFHALGATPIRDCYARLDRIVGTVRKALGPNDLLLIVSDHGFTTYRRDFHVNRFLVQEGYMALSDEVGGEGFASVRWDATSAYACGFAGVYLNLEGREGRGRVKRADGAPVARDIGKKLEALVDPATGLRPVRKAFLRDEVFRGPRAAESPDIVLALEPGYEFSSETALGACPRELFAANDRPWSGTHLCDPAAVPGILCANRRIAAAAPRGLDLAPTVLAALGLPVPAECEGRSFL